MGKALLKSLGTLGNVVWSGMKGLGRLLMGPIGSLVKSVGGMVLRLGTLGARIIAGIFTGLPGLFAAGGAIVGGWLAGIGLLVNEAVESGQIKKFDEYTSLLEKFCSLVVVDRVQTNRLLF